MAPVVGRVQGHGVDDHAVPDQLDDDLLRARRLVPAVLPDLQHLAGGGVRIGGRHRAGGKLGAHRHIVEPGVGRPVEPGEHDEKGCGLVDGAALLVLLSPDQIEAGRQARLCVRKRRKPLRVRLCAVRRRDFVPQDIAVQRGGHLVPRIVIPAPDIHRERGERPRRRQLAGFIHGGNEVHIKLCAAQGGLAVRIGNGQAHAAAQVYAARRKSLRGQEQDGRERAKQRGSDALKPLHRRHLHGCCWAAWAAAAGTGARAASGSPRWAPRAAARSGWRPP